MTLSRWGCVPAALILDLVACSSSGGGSTEASSSSSSGGLASTSSTSTSSTSTSSSSSSSSSGSSDCTPPSLTGAPAITVTTVAQPFPSAGAVGGTIATGTYFQTHVDVYEGGHPDNNTRAVFVFDEASMVAKEIQDDKPAQPFLGTYQAPGSMLVLTVGCGGTGSYTLGYTWSAGSLQTYDPSNGRVATWVKQ